MAANISGLHQFANDVGPLPLKLLDDSYSTLSIALNTLSTFSNFYQDQGTTNAYTIQTTQYQFAAYTDGLQVTVRIANTNTGASTLNVNGLGAMPVLNQNGTEMVPGQLLAGSVVQFVYNAQRQAWQVGIASSSVVSSPFIVTTPDGQTLLNATPDEVALNVPFDITSPLPATGVNGIQASANGYGHLGVVGNGLSWDPYGGFWFDCPGARLLYTTAPFAIYNENCTDVFRVNDPTDFQPGKGVGTPLVEIGPDVAPSDSTGSGANWNTGPVLGVTGGVGYPALKIDGAAQTAANIFAAQFTASCATPGMSNGVSITAGTNASDSILTLKNCAGQIVASFNGDGTITGNAQWPLPPLIDLPGITITNPQPGDVLSFDSQNNQWVNAPPVGVPTTLEQLTNVHVAGPAAGQVLMYSVNPLPGWVNGNMPGANFLNTLSIVNPQPADVLTWDGAGWIAAPPGQVAAFPLTSLSDVNISNPLNRQVLTWDAPNSRWINAPTPNPALATLPDVALTSQLQGQVLSWDSSLNRWVNSSLPGGSVIALGTLQDVNVSNPQNDQVLTWNYADARWENHTLPISPVITSPTNGQVLSYNGTNWVNTTPSYPTALAGLSDVSLGALTNGQLLTWNANLLGGRWVAGGNAVISGVAGSPILTVNQGNVATTGLQAYGGAANWAAIVSGSANSGASYGLEVQAGTTAADYSALFQNRAGTNLLRLNGDGSGTLGAGANGLSWTAAGAFSLTGTALFQVPFGVYTGANRSFYVTNNIVTDGATVAIYGPQTTNGGGLNVYGGLSNTTQSFVASFTANASAPNSNGVTIKAGKVLTDVPFLVTDMNNNPLLKINGDGSGLISPAPGQSSMGQMTWDTTGNWGIGYLPPSNTPRLYVRGRPNTNAMTVENSASPTGALYVLQLMNPAQGGHGLLIQAGAPGAVSGRGIPINVVSSTGTGFFYIYDTGETYFPSVLGGSGTTMVMNPSSGQIFYLSSSARFKKDIKSEPRKHAREVLSKLRTCSYHSNDGTDNKTTYYGLIAEEVEKIDPDLVTYDKEGKVCSVRREDIMLMMLPLLQELLGMDEPEGEIYG